jgi:hypothetical protein
MHGDKFYQNILYILSFTNLNFFYFPDPMPLPSSADRSIADQPCLVLNSREQYEFCHLLLPDDEKPIAGILANGKYYSLLRVLKERQKSRQIAARLIEKGRLVAITPTPKGEVLWIFEPEALPTGKLSSLSASTPQPAQTYRVLRSPASYEACQILVPDLAKPLTAIKVNSKCYGLLRRVNDENKAIELANRLSQRANEVIITQNQIDFSIWVLEPEAYLIG